ncbi:hypothetical protein HMPREF1981_03324 [Bacteroides pyogenes F0041]|uniref:Uncharacterized protein n=1 Tax=Bacteroides pyogenes F0041 TaxID=1321819 RepID=U2CBA4_9BACE|nr:hypothetical protein HMPREF1981_03324 [Bacteroides pyogenes F0041]
MSEKFVFDVFTSSRMDFDERKVYFQTSFGHLFLIAIINENLR